eukprot:scaffold2256_cov371-Prasinococcus_capsulatus_cf.AAC.10
MPAPSPLWAALSCPLACTRTCARKETAPKLARALAEAVAGTYAWLRRACRRTVRRGQPVARLARATRKQPRSGWVACWTCSIYMFDMVYIKHVVDTVSATGWERALYQNLYSLPLLVLTALVQFATAAEGSGEDEVPRWTFWATSTVLASCVVGTGLGYVGLKLREEISATAFTVVGVATKMASVLMNEFVEPEKNLFKLMSVGVCVTCSAMYRQAPIRSHVPAKPAPV